MNATVPTAGTPNDPAVVNSKLLMWGDPRRQVSPYSLVAARLLAARLMRLAQIGSQARRPLADAPAPVLPRQHSTN
jgi:hypothetical protein